MSANPPFEEESTVNKPPSFSGIRTFMGLDHRRQFEDADYAVIGIPFDTASTFRVGARFAPAAIREMSQLLRPYHPEHQVHVITALSGMDYGDIPVNPGNIEKTMASVEAVIRNAARAQVVPICLGGDHSVSLPVLRGLASVYGPMGLIHFDAHTDTWSSSWGEPYTHATPFRRAVEEGLIATDHAIQIGLRGPVSNPEDRQIPKTLGFTTLSTQEVLARSLDDTIAQIQAVVGSHPFYISLDIDVLDPAFAPGTGTPEAGGLSTAQLLQILRHCSVDALKGMDLVEVLPAYDLSQITAVAACHLLYEMIAQLAVAHGQ